MKTIYEHAVGGDGAVAGLYVSDDGLFIVEQVKYPMATALEPADKFIDSAVDGLEAKLSWTKAILDPMRAAAKAWLASAVGAVGG